MPPQNALRIATYAVLGVLSAVGCTGYVQPTGTGPSAQAELDAPRPRAAAPVATATLNEGSVAAKGALASPAAAVHWSGAIGEWCGPVEKQTIWLSLRSEAAACDVASKKVYGGSSSDTAEALTLELDPLQLTTVPVTLNVPAHYCPPLGVGCADVQVSLAVDSFTPGEGVQGSWAFTAPGRTELTGNIDASWCNWDDFLPAHPEAERLARDIKLKEISVYQGVKIPIMRDMQTVAQRNADLVQRREALLRVFVEPQPGFETRPLVARVTLADEGELPRRFEQIINLSGPSSETNGASSFNIELPKDAFNQGTEYSVELREASRCTVLSGTPVGARFPEQGMAPVGARFTGPVKVMLVPVRYEADGSGRMPDTSPAQLQAMSKRMYSMYPTTEVMLSVRDSVKTDRTLLGDMLDQMRELRAADGPPSDLAYYGMVRQADTFGDYCQGTCTTGIAGFGSQNGTSTAGMGIGFADAAASTFVHELGHIYRRPHSPCGGAASPDATYPYPDAKIGSWGYDFQTHELFDPGTYFDFMSYCSPDWISDYSYQRILERIIVVNQRAILRSLPAPGAAPSLGFRTLRVGKNGTSRWGLDLHPQQDPPGDPITLKALSASGAVLEDVKAFFEASPEDEDAYFIPAGHADWAAIQVPGVPAVPYGAVTQNTPFKR